jgi:hypothetical protein
LIEGVVMVDIREPIRQLAYLPKLIMKILGDPETIKFVLKAKKMEVERGENKLD